MPSHPWQEKMSNIPTAQTLRMAPKHPGAILREGEFPDYGHPVDEQHTRKPTLPLWSSGGQSWR